MDDGRVHVCGYLLNDASAGVVLHNKPHLGAALRMIVSQKRMVLHTVGYLLRQLLGKSQILPVKCPALRLVDQLNSAKDHILRFQRHTEHRPCDIPCLRVHLPGPSRVLSAIRNDQCLAAVHHLPGDSLARQQVDALQLTAPVYGHRTDAPILKAMVKPKRPCLRAHRFCNSLQHGFHRQPRIRVIPHIRRHTVDDRSDMIHLFCFRCKGGVLVHIVSSSPLMAYTSPARAKCMPGNAWRAYASIANRSSSVRSGR